MTSAHLKPGWRMVKFGEVVQNANLAERNPGEVGIERIVGLEHLDPENLHIRRWNTLENGTSFTRKFIPGQTLFGKRRAYQRKVAFAEFEGICSGDILTFESKDPKVLLPELLPFICQTDRFFDHALGTSAGSLSPRTSWAALKDFEFPLPPIEEQRRIAEILWAADEAVEEYLRAEEILSSLKRRLFREMLSRSHAVAMACSVLYSKPPRNGYSPRPNSSGKGAPTLSVGAVRNGRIIPEGNIKYAEISLTDLDNFRLSPGDILVVRGNGNKNLCGKVGMVESLPENCFYPDLLIRITFDENKILPEFAVEQWNDPVTHNRLLAYAKSTNGIWKINGRDVRQHKLLVPPIEAQEGIVDQLAKFREREETLSLHRENASVLKSGLANQLIEGNHHV